MTRETRSGHSRRSVLKTGAAVTTGLAVGATTLVSGQETTEIELEARADGWEGVTPTDIDGETNPSLTVTAGEDYTVTWTVEDDQPHNFVIEDADGNELISSEVIDEGSQTVEFTASGEMAEYFCEVHPESMRGEIVLADEDEAVDDNATIDDNASVDDDDDFDDNETDDFDDDDFDDDREFHATLDGDQHGIDTEASGEATFEVDEDETEIDYELYVEHICDVTQAHIHLGTEDEDGPVVVWLYPEQGQEPELIEGRFDGILAEGTFTADDFVDDWEGADMADAIETFEVEGAYVNVHTEAHPGGEIRGQIMPSNDL